MEKKFVIDKKTLFNVLASMQPICTKRTTLDATSNILFAVGHRELILKSTDLEISLQATCTLKETDIDEPQSFLVSGRRIFEFIKELEGDIQFSFSSSTLSLKAGAVHVTLNIKDWQEFPPFPERIENLMQLDASVLLAMFDKVAFLIPQNNANHSLNGLFLEVHDKGMTMTTTDGHCLAQVSSRAYTLDTAKKWLLPRRAVFEIKKIIEATGKEGAPNSAAIAKIGVKDGAPEWSRAELGVKQTVFLGVCGNQLVFSGASFNFFTKLLLDQFPNYTAIMDKTGFVPASLDRSEFIKTLRRSSCLLSGQFIATKFEFTPATLNVSMLNKEVGKLEEALPLEGFVSDKLEIRFYAPYLLNGLQALNEAKSSFYLKNASRPIIFESNEQNFQVVYLVMPVSASASEAL